MTKCGADLKRKQKTKPKKKRIINKDQLPIKELRVGGSNERRALYYEVGPLRCGPRQIRKYQICVFEALKALYYKNMINLFLIITTFESTVVKRKTLYATVICTCVL